MFDEFYDTNEEDRHSELGDTFLTILGGAFGLICQILWLAVKIAFVIVGGLIINALIFFFTSPFLYASAKRSIRNSGSYIAIGTIVADMIHSFTTWN